jgi:hypothetical protein
MERHMSTQHWRCGERATLLHVPHDVIREKIMVQLCWADARSCSRVCWYLRVAAKVPLRVVRFR